MSTSPAISEQATQIINILLSLPWPKRAEVFSEVKYNNIFCVNCGIGEVNRPNCGCQCENDE